MKKTVASFAALIVAALVLGTQPTERAGQGQDGGR